jgi:TonB-linked SusC/RagA family outer membrane protein
MRKVILTMLVALGFVLGAVAQDRTITGKVTDEKGTPLKGVSVTTSDRKGTKTDAEGNYSLKITSKSSRITFSDVNSESQTKSIGAENNINISLVSKSNKLDEIVIVAYGSVKKESFIGSSAKVTADAIKDRPLTNITNALTGAAPGVITTSALGQPGSTPSVRVRGFGSVTASSEPLYVVDGVPYTSALSNLNMDDVENLTVLKDAGSTALYGSRAANGVVMITTKKGKKGKTNISFKYNRSSTSKAIQDYNRVSAEEYMPLMWEAYRNSLAYRAASPLTLTAASNQASGLVTGQNGIIDLLAYNAFNLPKSQVVLPTGQLNPAANLIYNRDDLNWFNPITRTGIRNEYSLNFSGGAEKMDYFMSVAHTKEEGYINRSDFERTSARLTINSQMKSWVKVGLNLSFIKSGGNFASADGSNSIVNPFFFAARMGPIYPVYAYNPTSPGAYITGLDGRPAYDFGNSTIAGLPTRPAGAYGGRHTIAENELSQEYFKRNVFNGRAYLEFKLMEGLKFTTNLASDYTNRFDITYQNKVIGDGAPSGRSSKDYQTIIGTTFNQLLNYNKKIRRNNFDVLLGHENFKRNEDYLSGTRQGQILDGNVEFSNFTTTTGLSSREDNQNIESYFGNLRYDFDSKYLLSLSARTDGNSRFKKENRWGNFWSASAAWVVSKESFLSNSKVLNSLKLRSSYGSTGNDAGVGFYAYQTLYSLGVNNGNTPGILQSGIGNDSVTWEKNNQFDIGADFSLFKSRINGSVEYFNRVSNDLLFNVPLPLSSGFSSILKNIGSLYNRGWEITMDADVVRTKKFTWNIGFNATTLSNKITSLPQPEIISGTKKLQVGQSIYDYWLRQWYGVDPTDGAALFVANNPTGPGVRTTAKGDIVTIDPNNAKYDYSGTAIPDWYGGLTMSFKYTGFTLSALANWQKGGLTYDDTYAAYMHSGNYGASLHTDVLNRWQKPGDITNVPRMDNAQRGNFAATSTRWLTDASFLNIQNITLSYDFSNLNILPKANIGSARFYISVENVNMFTKRQGMNPGQSFTGVTSIGYIPARVINVGANINF